MVDLGNLGAVSEPHRASQVLMAFALGGRRGADALLRNSHLRLARAMAVGSDIRDAAHRSGLSYFSAKNYLKDMHRRRFTNAQIIQIGTALELAEREKQCDS